MSSVKACRVPYAFTAFCGLVYQRGISQIQLLQGASVNRSILQHCFFLVRQHLGGSRYRHFAANFKPF
jgi:hypothetical protein